MGTENSQHDDAIDKVLASLREATPPEGMQTRIAQRLANPATSLPTTTHWRDLLAGSTPAGAWWRGAIIGAATATFVIGAVLLIHRTLPAPLQSVAAINTVRPVSTPPQPTLASQSRAIPCARPAVLRVATAVPAHEPEDLRAETYAESTAPSRPAPVLPLTPQERSLARLARTADPRELASLNPEFQARLEAEHAAEFARFFAPPPSPPTPEVSPDANPQANQQPTPDLAPPVNE